MMQQIQKSFWNKLQVLSGAQLKYIAMLSMLIDHVNKTLIYPYLDGGVLLMVSDIFDILGRIAFPLFAFFLIEGFFQTKSRRKYLLLLLGFGVISEVPFDLCSTASWFDPNWNNIMFTFAMVLVTIWCIDALKGKLGKSAAWVLISLVIVAGMCLISMLSGVDYEYHAILTGYFFYIFREKRPLAIPFCFVSMYKSPWVLLGFALTLTYNGERGKQHKLLNYAFYPAHLLILGALRLWLGI